MIAIVELVASDELGDQYESTRVVGRSFLFVCEYVCVRACVLACTPSLKWVRQAVYGAMSLLRVDTV